MAPDTTSLNRTFRVEDFLHFSDSKATIREMVATPHSRIAVWGVRPGQEVPAHTHPDGQDTWIMLRGQLTYYLGNGRSKTIHAGDVDIAGLSEIHGAINDGNEDAVFLSVYNAPDIGWERAVP